MKPEISWLNLEVVDRHSGERGTVVDRGTRNLGKPMEKTEYRVRWLNGADIWYPVHWMEENCRPRWYQARHDVYATLHGHTVKLTGYEFDPNTVRVHNMDTGVALTYAISGLVWAQLTDAWKRIN